MNWNAPAVIERLNAAANRGVVIWIGIVERRAVELLNNPPKTGRIYRRRGVSHQASAPGEAPATDSGTLVNARRIDRLTAQTAARLVFTAEYAPHLEHGSKQQGGGLGSAVSDFISGHGGYLEREHGTRKLEPRPFAGRALHETLEEGRAALTAEIAASLR